MGNFLTDAADFVEKPFQALGNAIEGGGKKVLGIVDPTVSIPGLGTTTADPNIQTYSVPPEVAAAYSKIGGTTYDPRMVAPASSAAAAVQGFRLAPQVVQGAVQNKTLTNQDATNQYADRSAQLQEIARLRGIMTGATVSPAVTDNLALLGQGQALRTAEANSARGGTDQRAAAQYDARAANVTAGQANIAQQQIIQAQQQEAARAAIAQGAASLQSGDQAFMGAAYNIANADATRGATADVATQQAKTDAQIAKQNAIVQATAADQNANYNTYVANVNAKTQAFRDATAREQAAASGQQQVARLGIQSDRGATSAQQAAGDVQLGYQDALLRRKAAVADKNQKVAGAALSTTGQVAGKILTAA